MMIDIAEFLISNAVLSIYFLRTSLVIGGTYLLIYLWRNSSASTRSRIWRLGLVGLYFFPVLYFLVPRLYVGGSVSPLRADTIAEHAGRTLEAPPNAQRIIPASNSSTSAITASTDSQENQLNQERSFPIHEGLAFIWVLGIGVLAIRWVNNERLIRGIVKNGDKIRSKSTNQLFEELVRNAGIKKQILLLESAQISNPITMGILRPVILLPSISESWSQEQLRAAFIHELAHVSRRDYFFQTCVHVICVIYWMNPLVWVAKARMKLEQERACDDVVLQSMMSIEYAEHLLSIARWARFIEKKDQYLTHGAIGMAQEPILKQRVRSILSENTPRTPPTCWKKRTSFLLVVCLILPVAALKFESKDPGFTYVWHEAEEGALYGEMGVKRHEESSSFEYVEALTGEGEEDSSQGPSLSIRFYIDEAGKYVIWGRILAPTRRKNSFYVSVDRGEKVLWDTQGPDQEMTAKVWSWDRVRNRDVVAEEGGNPMAFYFDPGWHELRISGREKGTGLDRILITNNLIYRPRGKGNAAKESSLDYVWVEPENGRIVEPMQKGIDASASNESFVWTPEENGNADGEGVAYLRFHVNHDGEYIIWGRVLAPTANDNSFFVKLDNGKELLWDVYGPDKNRTAQAWWWDRVRDRATEDENPSGNLVFWMKKGWHTLALRSREAGTSMDRILITNDELFIPEGWGTSPKELEPIHLWMEAEDAQVRTPLTIGNDPEASNGGFIEVAGQHQSTSRPPEDGHAHFYVDIPVSGTYLLWGRVNAPASGDSFWLRVNGKRWIRWNGIQNGPGWHWEEVHDNEHNNRVLSIELQAGSHLIELAYREKNTKLDGLLLTNDLNYVPASTLQELVVQKREALVSAFRN